MLTKENIEDLATLARLELADEEKESFALTLGPVLAYVGEISAVVTDSGEMPRVNVLRNVMREDGPARLGGTFTDAILNNAPKTENGYVLV